MVKMQIKWVKIEPLKTRTKIILHTKEVIDYIDEAYLEGKEGWMLFTPDEAKQKIEDVMKNKLIGVDETKFSPSQKLRGTLMQVWENSGENIEFADFYTREMKKINNHYYNKYVR